MNEHEFGVAMILIGLLWAFFSKENGDMLGFIVWILLVVFGVVVLI